MKIAILKESLGGENRIALVPDSAAKLVSAGNEFTVQEGAGIKANALDADYRAAGAEVLSDHSEIAEKSDVLIAINRPPDEILGKLKPSSIVVSLLKPLDESERLKPFIDYGLTAISLEMIPRTTKAQSMDVLSSMATIAGYKAVLLAADRLPKMFPLLTTAAGTVPPAKVLVIGAGVAGLQAIATARRLGAVVEGFDIRSAAGEAVRSLGAKFIEIENLDAEGEGGYAKEVDEEVLEKSRELIAETAKRMDCIITTAQVPGKPSPRLITTAAVEGMSRGSVIVDLAAQNGGNCDLTRLDETVEHNGVSIFGPSNLPSQVPVHASQLFSRNVTAFLNHILRDGEIDLDFEDEIISGSCIVFNGAIRNDRVKALYESKNVKE